MTRDLVSIIIPVYNRPRLLADAVASAMAQTHRPIEVLIVDDGSTDTTAAVAQQLVRDHGGVVRHARVAHGGVARAMNEGLRLASGEFIQILDSDDLLLPEKLSRQIAGLRLHPGCGISYGYAREYVIDGAWSGHPSRRTGETFEELFPALLAGKIWPAPAPLFRRSVFDAIGEFLDVSIQTEWELECRAGALGVRLHHCREFVSDTRSTHHLEGRRKGAVSQTQFADYARVLTQVAAHARHRPIPPAAADQFARRAFAVARRAAAAGHASTAGQCLDLARAAAIGAGTRSSLACYLAIESRIGRHRAGRWSVGLERSGLAAALRASRRQTRGFYELWRYRAGIARRTVAGQSIAKWPALLKHKWMTRESARPLIFPSRT